MKKPMRNTLAIAFALLAAPAFAGGYAEPIVTSDIPAQFFGHVDVDDRKPRSVPEEPQPEIITKLDAIEQVFGTRNLAALKRDNPRAYDEVKAAYDEKFADAKEEGMTGKEAAKHVRDEADWSDFVESHTKSVDDGGMKP